MAAEAECVKPVLLLLFRATAKDNTPNRALPAVTGHLAGYQPHSTSRPDALAKSR